MYDIRHYVFRRRHFVAKVEPRVCREVDVAIAMHSASEVKKRSGVKIHVVVIESSELENRNQIIINRPGQQNLRTVCRSCCCTKAPSVAKSIQPGKLS